MLIEQQHMILINIYTRWQARILARGQARCQMNAGRENGRPCSVLSGRHEPWTSSSVALTFAFHRLPDQPVLKQKPSWQKFPKGKFLLQSKNVSEEDHHAKTKMKRKRLSVFLSLVQLSVDWADGCANRLDEMTCVKFAPSPNSWTLDSISQTAIPSWQKKATGQKQQQSATAAAASIADCRSNGSPSTVAFDV